LHISLNDKTVGVNRNSNEIYFEPWVRKDTDMIYVDTELPQRLAYDLLEKVKNMKIVVDFGPRFNLDYCRINVSSNDFLFIGNGGYNLSEKCDILKLGSKGARWHDFLFGGTGEEYVYTTGCGDLFDVIVMDDILKGCDKIKTLKDACSVSQEAARSVKGAVNKMLHINGYGRI
jgi:ribokinase